MSILWLGRCEVVRAVIIRLGLRRREVVFAVIIGWRHGACARVFYWRRAATTRGIIIFQRGLRGGRAPASEWGLTQRASGLPSKIKTLTSLVARCWLPHSDEDSDAASRYSCSRLARSQAQNFCALIQRRRRWRYFICCCEVLLVLLGVRRCAQCSTAVMSYCRDWFPLHEPPLRLLQSSGDRARVALLLVSY